MNGDLDLDERRAAALPRDYPQDMDRPTVWKGCTQCAKAFIGLVTRTLCRVCKEEIDDRTS